VGAWIWGIARRQAALWHRRYADHDHITEHEHLPDPAIAAVSRADLKEALRLLGPEGSDRRELARLVFVEDRPLSEAASRLGIPEGTVKSRIYKVRQVLQAALRKGGYEQ
jgi:RNA polymerase sigma-70 factor (ECF subfamily)